MSTPVKHRSIIYKYSRLSVLPDIPRGYNLPIIYKLPVYKLPLQVYNFITTTGYPLSRIYFFIANPKNPNTHKSRVSLFDYFYKLTYCLYVTYLLRYAIPGTPTSNYRTGYSVTTSYITTSIKYPEHPHKKPPTPQNTPPITSLALRVVLQGLPTLYILLIRGRVEVVSTVYKRS